MQSFNQLLRAALVFTLCFFPVVAFAQPVPMPKKADLVVVHKAKRLMELWAGGETIARYRVALGFDPVGPKQFEGDGRTPEGVYAIESRNENSKYFRSLKINYPNEADLRVARAFHRKPGGMVMIHGLPNDRDADAMDHPRKDWTEGCIAVNDDEMREIWDKVDTGTAVLIMP